MSASSLAKALSSVIGENSDDQAVTEYINTGFMPLNDIISGSYTEGIPQGRLMEIFGPPSSGKTAIATMAMIEAQRMGGVAGFMDHERSFDVEMAKAMGLNDEFPYWIYKREETWEKGNTMMVKTAKTLRESGEFPSDAPILFVFDSIAAAIPESMIGKDFDEYSMNDTTALARVASTTLKSMANFAEKYNFTVLYLNQIRMKPGVAYGDPTTTPGGQAMEFFASVRIKLGRAKIMEQIDGDKVFVGQEITMETVKNKISKPFRKAKWRMTFDDNGQGRFDVTTSMIDFLIDKGKLSASGTRVTWIDGKSYYRKVLAKHIDENGLQEELSKLLLS